MIIINGLIKILFFILNHFIIHLLIDLNLFKNLSISSINFHLLFSYSLRYKNT